MSDIIRSARLDLIPLTPAVLRALLAGRFDEVAAVLGVKPPDDWDIHRGAMELWLSQIEADPGLQPWLMRAMVLREDGIVIGDIGFHTAPGPEYLAALSPGGVEFGFSVLERWRRQGLATEASLALMRWAVEEHGVRRFVVSISPENGPSLALAAKLGFRKIGSHIDDEDGPKDIFERVVEPGDARENLKPAMDDAVEARSPADPEFNCAGLRAVGVQALAESGAEPLE
jgi:RimJ/RimL family protein N-acetyltransferase